MKTIFSAALVCMAVCACSTTPTTPVAASDLDVNFTCANGESVSILFSQANDTAVLTRNGERIELQQQRTASGFAYSNGPNTIRGKGRDLTMEIGRMMPIQCQAD